MNRKKSVILAKPKRGCSNPRNSILYRHLEELGWRVDEFSLLRCLGARYSFLHIHWPDRVFAGHRLLQPFRLVALALLFLYLRAVNVKIVYTVHNPLVKFSANPHLVRLYYEILSKALHGLIFPSDESKISFLKVCNIGRFCKSDIIPLGLQTELKQLGQAVNPHWPKLPARYVLLLGRIVVEKQIPQALEKWFEIRLSENVALVVAGKAFDGALLRVLKATERENEGRFLCIEGFLSDAEINHLMDNALAAFVPNPNGNSGVATLAIAHGRCVICTSASTLRSITSEYGPDTAVPLRKDLTISQLTSGGEPAARPTMKDIAVKTSNFFDRYVNE